MSPLVSVALGMLAGLILVGSALALLALSSLIDRWLADREEQNP